MSSTDDSTIREGSGNVFTDLGVENPEDAWAKAKLAHTIGDIIARRHLTQTQAAAILGIDQPKVSALLRGRLAGFSIERLLRFLLALNRDIDILIKPKPRRSARGHLNVVEVQVRSGQKSTKVAAGDSSSYH
ncbi:MAG: helix-turn-helix domain-containing protein [Chloroflexi bacterium]|nr:helix-turn-helix domain-containing protein [Chloroflexota bacterium]